MNDGAFGLTAKLAVMQQELKAPKNLYNSFGKFNYRSCEDILEAVKPLLSKYGCLLTLEDSLEIIGDRYYIKATARLINLEDEDEYTISAFARETENKSGSDQSQITGMASTYARKYALNGMFLIDDSKDADSDESQGEQSGKKPASVAGGTKCHDCGKVIRAVTWDNGKTTSAKKMAEQSKAAYNVPLCGDCYTLRKANGNTGG